MTKVKNGSVLVVLLPIEEEIVDAVEVVSTTGLALVTGQKKRKTEGKGK